MALRFAIKAYQARDDRRTIGHLLKTGSRPVSHQELVDCDQVALTNRTRHGERIGRRTPRCWKRWARRSERSSTCSTESATMLDTPSTTGLGKIDKKALRAACSSAAGAPAREAAVS